jgi:hypothetical protein
MKLIKQVIIGGLLVLTAIFTPATVSAVPIAEILFVETELGTGSWQYDYTVFNKSDPVVHADVNLFQVSFWFSVDIELINASVPNDWDSIYDNTSTPGYLLTFSELPGVPTEGADIAPGAFLDGFVFQFDQQVGAMVFEALFADPSGGDPFVFNGTTTPVPEPATILLLAAGISGLGFVRRRSLMSL